MTLPSGHGNVQVKRIDYPARLLSYGMTRGLLPSSDDPFGRPDFREGVDPDAMRNRALVFFGGLAVVVLLLGVAFGAASRRKPPAPEWVAIPPPYSERPSGEADPPPG